MCVGFIHKTPGELSAPQIVVILKEFDIINRLFVLFLEKHAARK